MRRYLYIIAAVALASQLWGDSAPASAQDTGAAAAAAAGAATKSVTPIRREVLRTMATLVGGVPEDSFLDSWKAKLDAGTPVEQYIDELLRSTQFSRSIAPSLLFGAFVNVRNYYAVPSGFILKRSTTGVMYLREPCSDAEAVSVHPWWNLQSQVKVCPDSYRPTKWTLDPSEHSYRSRMALSCDSQVGSPELESRSLCGCGPNLIRCMRDEDQYNELNKSLMNEVRATTGYVLEHDLPIKSLFEGTYSFRDRNAELYYRRQHIDAAQIADPTALIADLGSWDEASGGGSSWPAEGKWAPRLEEAPGQHAGVLTTPQILHWLPDRRQRQRGYYEVMWCNLRNSFGATTKQVLDLNASSANIAFVHDTWKRLAHQELCTNCHARLDYGFQFTMGYPDSRAGINYNPALALPGQGPLYGRDVDDPRGTANLTPAGFAELATAQPEFETCMAGHVSDYVLGEQATEEDRTEVAKTLHDGGFRAAMRVAMTRFVTRASAPMVEHPEPALPPAPPPAPAAAGGATDLITITPAEREIIDARCTDCHDEVAFSESEGPTLTPYNLKPAQLPRRFVVHMTEQVAFGAMPKHEPMPAEERERLVRMLIASLWSDDASRKEAEDYFLGKLTGLPAHQFDNAMTIVDEVAGARSEVEWGALERGIWMDQATITPGLVVTGGLEALRACRRVRDVRDKLSDCLERATAMQVLARWPLPQ